MGGRSQLHIVRAYLREIGVMAGVLKVRRQIENPTPSADPVVAATPPALRLIRYPNTVDRHCRLTNYTAW